MAKITFDFLKSNCNYHDGYFYFENHNLFDKYDIYKNLINLKTGKYSTGLSSKDHSLAIEFMTNQENNFLDKEPPIFIKM
jgi:hypothetical protein